MEPSELYSETWKLDGELGQPQYDQDKCQLSGTVKEPVFWVPVPLNREVTVVPPLPGVPVRYLVTVLVTVGWETEIYPCVGRPPR